MQRHIMIAVAVALACHGAVAATYYVDASRPNDSGDGLSWATAKKTIQAAVDAASAGDTVLVTNGVYASGERVTPEGFSSNRVVMTKNITVRSVNGPAVTIIQGRGPLGADAVRCVYMSAGMLAGFTLTNGFSATVGSIDDCNGGGAFASGAVISNCVISGNRAHWNGGAVNRGTVYDCVLSGNRADVGGGAFWGGMNNCVISGNTAAYGGGTAYGTVNNCVLSGNAATNTGGGMFESIVSNCTLVGNTATNRGGGTYRGTVVNSIVWGNRANVSNNHYDTRVWYSCTLPLPGSGAGNLATDPQFLNAAAGNYRLSESSPCINAGTNHSSMAWQRDLDGNPRIYLGDGVGIVDMGCYEYVPEPGGLGAAVLFTIYKLQFTICRRKRRGK